jgi:hypothetical protein
MWAGLRMRWAQRQLSAVYERTARERDLHEQHMRLLKHELSQAQRAFSRAHRAVETTRAQAR